MVPGGDEAHRLLTSLLKSKSFSDFLLAFRHFLQLRLPAGPLLAAFRSISSEMSAPGNWRDFQDAIAIIDFNGLRQSKQHSKAKRREVVPSENSPDEQAALATIRDAVAKLEERERKYQEIVESDNNEYYLFLPGIELDEELRKTFEADENPALVIGRYVRALFSKPDADKETKAQLRVPATKEIAALIDDVLLWEPNGEKDVSANPHHRISTADHRSPSILLSVLRFLNPTEELSSDDTEALFVKILVDSYDLTQDLFESVLFHKTKLVDHDPGDFRVFGILAQLPFGEPYRTIEDLRHGTGAHLLKDPRLPWELKDAFSLPYVPWSYLRDLFRQYELYLTTPEPHEQDIEAIFHLLAAKFHKARIANGGYSPLSPRDINNVFIYGAGLCLELPDDLVVGLSYMEDLTYEGYPFGLSWMRKGDRQLPEDLQDRAKAYLKYSRAARNDGFDELASAMMAFFIYSQALVGTKGLFIPWGDVRGEISALITSPVWHRLKACIAVSATYAESNGCRLEAMTLRSLIAPASPRAEVVPSRPVKIRHPHREKIEADLRSDLGENTCKKFSQKTIDLLVDAELGWSRLSRGLGRDQEDRGTLAVAFVKPIEVELAERIGKVFLSDEHHEYYSARGKGPPPRPTLGPLLHMLKGFDSLPSGVQTSIKEQGVLLQTDPIFIKKLLKLVDLRNRGAHGESVTDNELLNIRSLLLKESGLKRLGELLG